MKLITDMHIHSHFSLATSKQLTPEYLELWSKMKGLNVVATGDFTHPGWIKELKDKIEPAEPGLFQLKKDFQLEAPIHRFNSNDFTSRFILSAEISSIYKKNGKVRKVHSVVLAPDFETVEKIQQKLLNIGGNITSDGRPILGLDAKDLLEMCLDANENICFIPAHIWTPWFSVLGAKSGFDSIEECFQDLTPHISAVETGLSTNAPMNWMISFLDKYTLLSNSDAHSPEKLGRNANIMDCDLSYEGIINTMKSGNGFLGTIDMYPQEGKYHYDGHRKCGVCYDPVETLENDGICTKCDRKITVGVMNRIVQLSDRENLQERPNRKRFHSIIPLKEILSEITGVSQNTKTVARKYNEILTNLGSELDILLNIPVDEIEQKSGDILSEAINRMRNNKVFIKEGFDGEFGVIKVFSEGELESDKNLPKLFPEKVKEKVVNYKSQNLLNFSLERFHELFLKNPILKDLNQKKPTITDLNVEQQQAVEYFGSSCLVVAGPGTGKTRALVHRIAHLIDTKKNKAENILAVTFTNKAANEIRDRVGSMIENEASRLNIFTFHGLGLEILKNSKSDFTIIDDSEQKFILEHKLDIKKSEVKTTLKNISLHKQNYIELENVNVFNKYQEFLHKNNLLDIDDLVFKVEILLRENSELSNHYKNKFQQILIDEYQDINESQFRLIKQISDGDNFFVIGDVNQAIYGFRGADKKYIENFAEYFPDVKTINFSTSYRCSQQILKASANVIENENPLQGLKKGVKINIHKAETDKSEAEFIARKIEKLTGGMRFFSIDSDVINGIDDQKDVGLDEIVVLCRTKAIMPSIIKAFNNHAIPYEVVDNKPFYKEEPIKSIIDLYKVFVNEEHSVFIKNDKDLSILKSISKECEIKEVLEMIIDKYFQNKFIKHNKEIQRLLDFAEMYKDHDVFLQKLTLGVNEDVYSIKAQNIKIMTLHASKGLEFNHVFIAGCEDRLLPFSLYQNLVSDFEEEKRLFYVGMTRSKKHLYLSNTKSRYVRGVNYTMNSSPFLEKIKVELLKQEKNKYKKKIKKEDNQLDLF